jgi:two-component system, cell cycle response regulator DivK
MVASEQLVLVVAGLQTVSARDGAEAIQQAMATLPEVIVTNLQLPGVDGWTLTRRLKSNARTKHIPIIAISGQYMLQELAERSRAAGFAACLLKPCAPEDLIREVRAAMPQEHR